MAKKSVHYVNGPEVTAALNKFYYERLEAIEKGLPEPKLPPIVGDAIYMIAKRYSSAGKFSRVPNKQDMVSSGIISAMETTAKTYDPEKSATKNCFSFLTTLVYFGFLAFFQEEKKALKAKNAYIEALADGQATIGGQTVDRNNTSLKQLREMIDEYKMNE